MRRGVTVTRQRMKDASWGETISQEETSVEHLISDLVGRFERGRLTRRQLVQALAAVAAAGVSTPVAGASLKSGSINHTTVLVSDMARCSAVYNRVFRLA